MAAVRHLGFLKVQRPNMRHLAKFCEDTLNRSGDMADFRFFKMAAAAIFDFGNFKFLTVGTVYYKHRFVFICTSHRFKPATPGLLRERLLLAD